MQFQEKKKGEKQKSEYFQTQWRKHVDKLTIPPKQTPVYLAVSKGPSKEKKHRTGEPSRSWREQHILTPQIYKRVYLFLFILSYRVG